MDPVADDYAHLRRAHALHEPRRCVVLNAAGEGLAYCDDIETALQQAKRIPGARSVADAVSGVVYAHHPRLRTDSPRRLPWDQADEEPEVSDDMEDQGDEDAPENEEGAADEDKAEGNGEEDPDNQ